MTNKEAKEKLYMEWQKFLEDNIDYAGISEAYKTAFKALEQEPCEDAISRQAVLDYIHRIFNQGTGKKKSFEFIQKYVEKLPPVTPSRHVDCEGAEHDGNGCLGYSHYGDDFPIKECLHCPKYTSYEEELQCKDD